MEELEYIQTLDMSDEEKKEWEVDSTGIAITTDTSGVMEMYKTEWFDTDKESNIISGTEKPTLAIALYDPQLEREIWTAISDRDSLRRLRDYLNDYLEIHSTKIR